jgi:hypothetical protein
MSNKDNNPTAIPDNAVVVTSRTIRQAYLDFVQAKADEKDAKERKAQAEAILRTALDPSKGKIIAFFGKVKAFSLVASKTTSFDRELLEKKYPEAYAETLKVTEYDYIRTA